MNQILSTDFQAILTEARIERGWRYHQEEISKKSQKMTIILARSQLLDLLDDAKKIAKIASQHRIPTIKLCKQIVNKQSFMERLKGTVSFSTLVIAEGWFIMPGSVGSYDKADTWGSSEGSSGVALGRNGKLYLHSHGQSTPITHVSPFPLQANSRFDQLRPYAQYISPAEAFMHKLTAINQALANFYIRAGLI